MTNSIGYANPAGTNLGTLALEKLQVTRADRIKATAVVRSWLPEDEADEILTILGIEKEGK